MFGTPDAEVITIPDVTDPAFFGSIVFVKKYTDWVNDVWETGEITYILVNNEIKFFTCSVTNSFNCQVSTPGNTDELSVASWLPTDLTN